VERLRARENDQRCDRGRDEPRRPAEELAAAIGNRAFSVLARQETPTAEAATRSQELNAEAQRHYAREDYREALALWERARETAGLSPRQESEFLFNIGMCNLRLERFATAIFFFEHYVEDPDANRQLGEQRLDEARRGAGVVVGAGSEGNARRLHERARQAYADNEFARALVLWERGRQQPGLGEEQLTSFLFNIGMCNLMLERYGSAVAVFEEYLESPHADRETGENRLHRARAGVGAAEAAEDAPAEPGDEPGEALFREGQRLFDAEDYPEAIAVWERARETAAATGVVNSGFLFNIGLANMRLERFATAIFFFEEYLEAPGPNADQAREHLAEARSEIGAEDSGRLRDPRALHARATSAYNDGRYARALILWERARQQPGLGAEQRTSLLFNVGMSNLMLERFGSAVAVFEEYLRSPHADPETGEDRLRRAQAGVGGPASSGATSSPSSPPSSP
jgi:tetratricopeptide (TPR) repeat protein